LIGAGSREGGTSKHTNYNENNNNNNSKLLRHSTGETQQHSNKQNNPGRWKLFTILAISGIIVLIFVFL
jgi:hypothetical protein